MSRWRGIRTSYRREIRNQRDKKSGCAAGQRRQYAYFGLLRFLDQGSQHTSSNVDDMCESDEVDENDVIMGAINDYNDFKKADTIASKRAKYDDFMTEEINDMKKADSTDLKPRSHPIEDEEMLIQLLSKKVCQEEREVTIRKLSEEEEDRLFLLSLTSYLRKVPHDRKLKLKMDMMLVIQNALESYQRNIALKGQQIVSTQNLYQQDANSSGVSSDSGSNGIIFFKTNS